MVLGVNALSMKKQLQNSYGQTKSDRSKENKLKGILSCNYLIDPHGK